MTSKKFLDDPKKYTQYQMIAYLDKSNKEPDEKKVYYFLEFLDVHDEKQDLESDFFKLLKKESMSEDVWEGIQFFIKKYKRN
jgi:hypothetical protein